MCASGNDVSHCLSLRVAACANDGSEISRFVDKYYSAYEKYISGYGAGVACVGGDAGGGGSSSYATSGPAPPVWIGCCHRDAAAVSGSCGFGFRVGDVPLVHGVERGSGDSGGCTQEVEASAPEIVGSQVAGVVEEPKVIVDGSDAVPVRGKNYDRNQRKKLGKKNSRLNRVVSGSWRDGLGEKPSWRVAKAVESEDVDGAVKESVKRKWIAKNELQALEAERKVALLKASSIEDAVKAESTRVRASVESNMVRIEKSHAFLSSTGNVPGQGVLARDDDQCVQGSVETVVSGGSISPDSSASQSEFRAAQKKILDLEAEMAELKKMVRKRTGLSVEAMKDWDKRTFTDNSENGEIMCQLFGDAYVCHTAFKDGKKVVRIGPEDHWFAEEEDY